MKVAPAATSLSAFHSGAPGAPGPKQSKAGLADDLRAPASLANRA
jgi:hypothetical protein